jgi:diaminopimelate decarboxylase
MSTETLTQDLRGQLLLAAATHGTPLYVYDGAKIVAQYQRLQNAFKGVNLGIKYACKALNNTNILRLLRAQGAGLDTVSVQEIELGLRAGFLPGEIMFTPNCVDFAEYQRAVELGVSVTIDNIPMLEQFGHTYGSKVPCCIRFNPHIVAGGNTHIQTGHIDSKFGISIHQLRHVQRIIESEGIVVEGLHIHTGSDILDAGVFVEVAEILLEMALKFPNLRFVDFGSGFKVAYKEGDVTTDIEELGARMSARFREFCAEYGRELQLFFEPGKFLVSESGYLLVSANVIKQTTATVFVGVNSGQNHLIRPMFYDAYHRIENLSNPLGTQRIYTVVGYICETDTFGWDRKLAEVREGDVLALFNAGAYGFTMSNQYNARLRPAEVLLWEGKIHLIRERETLEDVVRGERVAPIF